MAKIKISFLGAARVVTGSCYLLEHQQTKFLIDCGMFQGSKSLEEHNYREFPFNPGEIDFVLLTHAHIDHSGLLPKLYKSGFSGPTYGTSGTVELCKIMLPDSGYIQESEVERKNKKARRSGGKELTPIYTAQDAEACVRFFEKRPYNLEFEPAPGIKITFRDAGHILGSSILELVYEENEQVKKMVLSGDLGRSNQPILNDPYIVQEANYLVLETTYGDRFHDDPIDNDERMAQAINETFQRGGNVIIPAFAVDRTQDLLYTLNRLMDDGKINPQSIYVDSPLAIAATEIFCKHPQYFDEETKEFMEERQGCPFHLKNLNYSHTAEESMALNKIKSGALIISASGMAEAGRIKHHLKHNLWRRECTVIFVGYQAEGTLGRRIVDGAKKVKIHGEEVVVKARILMLEGYSAHADQKELVHWLDGFKKIPEYIFLTHGEEKGTEHFAQILKEKYQAQAIVPSMGEGYELEGKEPMTSVCGWEPRPLEYPNDVYDQIMELLQPMLRSELTSKLSQIRDYIKKIG
ncbi:MBL fold metallo-hydrolase [Dehalobacterium formicoaceticum]|uniref:MBL fold metallo-hydrolase n=1 Tax=Dehalobacterium formicoaceticum TaxID=51515 RepID=A0ABT1Y640_9FIRM|nr:MBL fold metallo-hydrolase [Dehalobacterium formicoaceticum]MCR6546344.1 MBL fold metallo-hydrolase [Dehalobacterium formicoaceticum]